MSETNNRSTEFLDLIGRIGRLHMSRADGLTRELGTTPMQGRVLSLIEDSGDQGMIQRAISDRTGMAPASVTRMLTSMEDDGLITRITDEHDSRKKTLHLQPKARQILEQFRARITDYQNRVLDPLTPEESNTLVELLERLASHLKEES